jgi:hypothetical protein
MVTEIIVGEGEFRLVTPSRLLINSPASGDVATLYVNLTLDAVKPDAQIWTGSLLGSASSIVGSSIRFT